MDKKQISNVVKAILNITGTSRQDIAVALGKKPQGLSDQLQRGSFSAVDLIAIAERCGAHLAFVDRNGKAIVTFPAAESQE